MRIALTVANRLLSKNDQSVTAIGVRADNRPERPRSIARTIGVSIPRQESEFGDAALTLILCVIALRDRVCLPQKLSIESAARKSVMNGEIFLRGEKSPSLFLHHAERIAVPPSAGRRHRRRTHMKSSRLSRALFATVLLPMAAQPQLSRANWLLLPSGSYEITARLELPHLERWAVDKTTTICAFNPGIVTRFRCPW
jgi:hypothetical protein